MGVVFFNFLRNLRAHLPVQLRLLDYYDNEKYQGQWRNLN